MHTASISHLRSAVQDYFDDDNDDSDWYSNCDLRVAYPNWHPHQLEHETAAAELMDDDEDAAMIHRLLGRNRL